MCFPYVSYIFANYLIICNHAYFYFQIFNGITRLVRGISRLMPWIGAQGLCRSPNEPRHANRLVVRDHFAGAVCKSVSL